MQPFVDVFATGELPIVNRGGDADLPLRRVRDLGPTAAGERRATVEPIDDLWTTSEEVVRGDAASEPTPMHTDRPLDPGLGITTEVPVTASPPTRDTLRIIGDEPQ